MFLVPRIADLC